MGAQEGVLGEHFSARTRFNWEILFRERLLHPGV